MISKGTSEQTGVIHHQTLTSPASTGLPKSSSDPKETYSEVPKLYGFCHSKDGLLRLHLREGQCSDLTAADVFLKNCRLRPR